MMKKLALMAALGTLAAGCEPMGGSPPPPPVDAAGTSPDAVVPSNVLNDGPGAPVTTGAGEGG